MIHQNNSFEEFIIILGDEVEVLVSSSAETASAGGFGREPAYAFSFIFDDVSKDSGR